MLTKKEKYEKWKDIVEETEKIVNGCNIKIT